MIIELILLALTAGAIKFMTSDGASRNDEFDYNDEYDYRYHHIPTSYATGYNDEEDGSSGREDIDDILARMRSYHVPSVGTHIPDVDEILRPYNMFTPQRTNRRTNETTVSTGTNRRYYRFDRRTGRLEYSEE